MNMPTFMLIGAQKCGTTWLDGMLRQHPEVFISKEKELHFWDKEARWQGGMEAYARYFMAAQPTHRAVGECTPNYFWTTPDPSELAAGGARNAKLPNRIAAELPDLKLVVLLRDPTERAVSAYFHHIRKKRVRPTQSILEVMGEYGIASMGHYDLHLEAWWRCFPKENLKVLFYEEAVRNNKAETLRTVFEHIGVDPGFEVQGIDARLNRRRSDMFMRMNLISTPVAWAMEYLAPASIKNADTWKIHVSDEERESLKAHFAPHNDRLSTLLERELPW